MKKMQRRVLFLVIFCSFVIYAVTDLKAEDVKKIKITGLMKQQKLVKINAGSRDGVTASMVFVIKRGDKNVGKIQITAVDDFSSRGTILEGAEDISSEDDVITEGKPLTASSTTKAADETKSTTTAVVTSSGDEALKSLESKLSEISSDVKALKTDNTEVKEQLTKITGQSPVTTVSAPTPAKQPAQTETEGYSLKGKKEISFLISHYGKTEIVADGEKTDVRSFYITAKIGFMVSEQFEVRPSIGYTSVSVGDTSDNSSNTTLGLDVLYNFTGNGSKRTIPYIGVGFLSSSPSNGSKSNGYGFGAGLRNFLTKYNALQIELFYSKGNVSGTGISISGTQIDLGLTHIF